MARRKKKADPAQMALLEARTKTAPCVPAIRTAVAEWRDNGYKGATKTSKTLLNYWFHTDHRLPNGQKSAYYPFQREAIETLIYIYEVARKRRHKDLLETYAEEPNLRLLQYDNFSRLCLKMATGTGKTKVISLAIAWQYFNAVLEDAATYAATSLLIAPNVIVYQRLHTDFVGGKIFRTDPIIPPALKIFWEFDCYMRGDSERASSQGALYVANIQQLYEREDKSNDDEPDIMTMMLGSKPPAQTNAVEPFEQRILKRGNPLFVVNDEAHHTHDEESEWNRTIRRLYQSLVSLPQMGGTEGWDVQSVTVVVGLRPYTSKANILPEQTIGRGLRLMFRGGFGPNPSFREQVDVIGNKAFIQFVEQLERNEDLELETVDLDKEPVVIETIFLDENKLDKDIIIPVLSPMLTRKRTLAAEIAAIDVSKIQTPRLPKKRGDAAAQSFTYEGYDIITLEKIIDRQYTIPEVQTSQEVISYYAKRIAHDVKLPSQFAALVPKVREFLTHHAFGETVDLNDPVMIKAISHKIAQHVTVKAFAKILRDVVVQEQTPVLEEAGRPLSDCPGFPWSRPTLEASKTVFNLVAADNKYEKAFAAFLQKAPDVVRFSKIPERFGFTIAYTDSAANLRYYEPDFVAVTTSGLHHLIETKGREDVDVKHKDRAAQLWCENATLLTGTQWEYKKVMQKGFEKLQPDDFEDLIALEPITLL